MSERRQRNVGTCTDKAEAMALWEDESVPRGNIEQKKQNPLSGNGIAVQGVGPYTSQKGGCSLP